MIDFPSGEKTGEVTKASSLPRMAFESKSDIDRMCSSRFATYAICEPSGEIATIGKFTPVKFCPSGSTYVERDTGNNVGVRNNHPPIPVSPATTSAVIAMGKARAHGGFGRAWDVGWDKRIGSLMRNRAAAMSPIRSRRSFFKLPSINARTQRDR